jgi:hypothetical protein
MTIASIMTNQIRLEDDIYPFFEKYDSLDKKTSIKYWPMSCRCRRTQVKVGYALKRMEEEGLLKEFEEYLVKSRRTISGHYARAYLEHQRHLRGQ